MAADWYKFLSDFLSLLHMSYCTQTQKTRCIHRQLLSIEKNEMHYFHIVRRLQGHIRYRIFLSLTFLWSIMPSIFSSTPFYDLQSLIHRYLLDSKTAPYFHLLGWSVQIIHLWWQMTDVLRDWTITPTPFAALFTTDSVCHTPGLLVFCFSLMYTACR